MHIFHVRILSGYYIGIANSICHVLQIYIHLGEPYEVDYGEGGRLDPSWNQPLTLLNIDNLKEGAQEETITRVSSKKVGNTCVDTRDQSPFGVSQCQASFKPTMQVIAGERDKNISFTLSSRPTQKIIADDA